MVKCTMKFENDTSGIFYTGSFVKGHVEVFLENPIQVRNILFTMKAKGWVQWAENQYNKHQYTVTAEEDYFQITEYLYGTSDSRKTTLSKGSHTYTFTFFIPKEAPSSFEGKYGYIRYITKVNFNRPFRFDLTFTETLKVVKNVDLNYECGSIREYAKNQIETRFCCWPCTRKPLNIEVYIPKSGYVVGQSIPVTINLHNKSGKEIQKLEIFLNRIICYKNDQRPPKIKIEIIAVNKMNIDFIQNLVRESINVNLLVTATIPSFSVKIIEVKHEVNVRVNVRLPHKSPIIKIPVAIGNIPLYNGNQNAASNEIEFLT